MDSLVDFSKETQVKVQTAESQRKGKQIGIMAAPLTRCTWPIWSPLNRP